MIQRSGSSARSRSPISAATVRTRSTLVLSSVSGIVKNCGAWGSIAPPITLDIMVGSPCCRKDMPQSAERQADRLHSSTRRKYLAANPPGAFPRAKHVAWRHYGRGADYDCVQQL